MASSGPSSDWLFRGQNLNGERPLRHVLRFNQKVQGTDVPSVPERYRSLEGPIGKLAGARLRPATGEAWLRIQPTDIRRPWRRVSRTIPLNESQSPTPTLDVLELRGGMRVYCHDGYIGRLEGIATNARAGVVSDLLVRVRGDVLSDVETLTSPLAYLLDFAGQRLLLSPAWAASTKREDGATPFRGGLLLQLDASAEQVASGMRLRPDGDVAADIWNIFVNNPALAPHTGDMRISVHDGDVTVLGTVPSPRHRASAEQDIWHVPGVFSVHNELVVGG